jgi:hypothetical protein
MSECIRRVEEESYSYASSISKLKMKLGGIDLPSHGTDTADAKFES